MLRAYLLTAFGFALAFFPLLLKLPDLPAFLVFPVIGAGALWAAWAGRERRGAGMILTALPAAALAGHALWYFSLSSYAPPGNTPALDAPAPDITATRVRDGATFRLSRQRGRAALLVFFRGGW